MRTRGHVTDRDFMRALFDVQTLSFDATDYEKTSIILDLNVPFNRQAEGGKLLGTLDSLYDGGCLDNVWSPAQSLMNMSSLLQPGGRIFNWACSSGWPGAFCTVSPEWLLSFYALNDFRNIRVYHFHPIGEHSKWPNPTAAVFRYSPHFTRDPNYNPFSASMVETSHPSFVVAVAESSKYRAPEDWEMPMQSHYLFGDYA